MSYLPVPRCIAIPCTTDPSDLSYFIVLSMALNDYNYLNELGLVQSSFLPLSLDSGVLEYGYFLEYTFNDPADPILGGGAFDVLLPCCPTNGPAANTFIMNYYNSETNSYPPGTQVQCPITQTGGTINPPKKRPSRDMGDDVGTPYPFFLVSANDPSNISLGVAIDIPANINPRLNAGVPDPDPTKLSLVADTALNSNAYDIAIYNVQPLGQYTSIYVTFPDGSISSTIIGSSTQSFTI